MDLILGYLAGLLTLINPCVLPVLPIVLATALLTSRWGPLALCAGLCLSFVTVGIGVAAFGRAIGLTPEEVAKAGAILMVGFGLTLLIPQLSASFATATAGLAAHADAGIDHLDRSAISGQFLSGLLLGAVWVPCVGPTLGGAIALAYSGQSLLWATAVMASFALGISTIILALGYGAQAAIRARRDSLRNFASKARPAMGIIFVLTGLFLFFDLQRYPELWLINHLPVWLQDLSVRY
jgi:cytochrome c-type biogenesis protein